MHCVTMYRFVTSLSLAAVLAGIAALPADLQGQVADSKLTTVLAELARVGRPLAVDAMSASVQDAVRGGWLPIDGTGQVQVYILVNALTEETAGALAAAGVTIEVRDPARRRVQARLPVAQLQAVAALPFVDAIRLPSYARYGTGAATSEGDGILQASAVRSQFSLDGSGVRVGVISDGLKGVFATGCTTSCAGADNGPIATGDLPAAAGVRNASGVLTSATGNIVARSFRANGDLEG